MSQKNKSKSIYEKLVNPVRESINLKFGDLIGKLFNHLDKKISDNKVRFKLKLFLKLAPYSRPSLDFLSKEINFTEEHAKKLAYDPEIIKGIEGWESGSERDKKNLAHALIGKFNSITRKEYKLTTRFDLMCPGNSAGEYCEHTKSIRLYTVLETYKTPFKLISVIAHEHLGHGRQRRSEFNEKQNTTKSDITILRNSFNCYIHSSDNLNKYKTQPAEIHANLIGNIFVEKLIESNPRLAELHEYYVNKTKASAIEPGQSSIKAKITRITQLTHNSPITKTVTSVLSSIT